MKKRYNNRDRKNEKPDFQGGTDMEISSKKKIELYMMMLEMRLFEEKAIQMFREASAPGHVHVYVGEEAVAAGFIGALRKDDYVVSTHRCHGHCIAKGADLGKLMAEICGRDTGYCGGRGGSMHIYIPEIGFLGSSGIVGGAIPMAVGAALQSKLQDTGRVTVSFFGDGACNQGTFHESLNLASLWKLPVIFVCENNLYAGPTSTKRSTSVDNIAVRADSYSIPGVIADGMDVLDVYEKALKAVKRARSGKGPILIECKTYRFYGHFDGDPGTSYRTKKEVERWKLEDPVPKMLRLLLTENIVQKEKLQRLEDSIRERVQEAARFASKSPWPKPESALI